MIETFFEYSFFEIVAIILLGYVLLIMMNKK